VEERIMHLLLWNAKSQLFAREVQLMAKSVAGLGYSVWAQETYAFGTSMIKVDDWEIA
jgi:hypothetical protein